VFASFIRQHQGTREERKEKKGKGREGKDKKEREGKGRKERESKGRQEGGKEAGGKVGRVREVEDKGGEEGQEEGEEREEVPRKWIIFTRTASELHYLNHHVIKKKLLFPFKVNS
jgi:hypothetical protein